MNCFKSSISRPATRVNPGRNIFSKKCGSNTYFITSMRFWSSSTPNFLIILFFLIKLKMFFLASAPRGSSYNERGKQIYINFSASFHIYILKRNFFLQKKVHLLFSYILIIKNNYKKEGNSKFSERGFITWRRRRCFKC